MSGHSKWSTIKRQKGANDAKRGQTFTKIANAITIAARVSGSGDPTSNLRLRMVLDGARAVNMPKDNIQRAIDRGLGKLGGQVLEEVLYEGFGPEKVAFIVEGVTDNKQRTTSLIRNIFDRSGGVLGSPGVVSYMFDKKAEIKLLTKGQSADEEELELIDLGAEDIEEFEEEGIKKYLVYGPFTSLGELSNKVTRSGYTVENSEIIYKPNTIVSLEDPEKIKKVLNFSERLEEQDDIQKVFANFDISDKLLEEMQG